MPQRIQRKRTKGWRIPEGAVYVGRGSRWGNPFKVGEKLEPGSPLWPYVAKKVTGGARGLASLSMLWPAQAVDAYESWLIEQPALMLSLGELAGRDLACWCPLDQPCHADVLLELVNGGVA